MFWNIHIRGMRDFDLLNSLFCHVWHISLKFCLTACIARIAHFSVMGQLKEFDILSWGHAEVLDVRMKTHHWDLENVIQTDVFSATFPSDLDFVSIHSSPALHLLPSSSSFSSSSLQFERPVFFFQFHLAFSALLCPTQGESTSFQTQPYFSNTSWSLESTSRPHTLYRLLLCELVCFCVWCYSVHQPIFLGFLSLFYLSFYV